MQKPNADLQKQLKFLEGENADVQQKHDALARSAKNELESHEANIANWRRANDVLATQLAAVKKELDAKKELGAIRSEKFSGSDELAASKKEVGRLERQVASQQADLDAWISRCVKMSQTSCANLDDTENEKARIADEQLEELRKKNASFRVRKLFLQKVEHETEQERVKLHTELEECLRDLEEARNGLVHQPYMGFDANEKAMVIMVMHGGPAAVAGVQHGDKVLKVGSVAIATLEQFRAVVTKNVHPGMTVAFTLERGGKRMVVDILVQCISMKEPSCEEVIEEY